MYADFNLSFEKDSKYCIFYLVSKLLWCLETSVVYNSSKMFRERMVIWLLVLRHKIGNIIYFYSITAAKGGPSLSQLHSPNVTVK